MNFLKITNPDDLLNNQQSPRIIESQIIDYIMTLREQGVSYFTIKSSVAPIFTFYKLNYVSLNRANIARYYGEIKKVVRDKAYSTEDIQKALQNADARMRMMILLLSSTACRVGALPELTLGHLTRLPDYNMYKIVFYEGTNNEYITFCTRECATTGIENYLLYRQRCGERISFNEQTQRWEPDNSPLIRPQFDMNDVLQARNPQPMKLHGLRTAITYHLIRCGLREHEHPTADNPHTKRIRKNVSLTKGFRKRAISMFIEAELNHEIRELIVDHETGLDANYFRPSEDQILREYLKAEPFLTIDDTQKVKRENEILKIEVSKVDGVLTEIAQMRQQLGLE